MANLVQARLNCIDKDNNDWTLRHEDKLNELINYLPHGSGLDSDWNIDFNKSHGNKLVFYMGYHAMDENGYYDGWIDFTLIVKPSLIHGITLHIRGNFGKYQDIKDYLYDILRYSLESIIEY